MKALWGMKECFVNTASTCSLVTLGDGIGVRARRSVIKGSRCTQTLPIADVVTVCFRTTASTCARLRGGDSPAVNSRTIWIMTLGWQAQCRLMMS